MSTSRAPPQVSRTQLIIMYGKAAASAWRPVLLAYFLTVPKRGSSLPCPGEEKTLNAPCRCIVLRDESPRLYLPCTYYLAPLALSDGEGTMWSSTVRSTSTLVSATTISSDAGAGKRTANQRRGGSRGRKGIAARWVTLLPGHNLALQLIFLPEASAELNLALKSSFTPGSEVRLRLDSELC